MKVSFIATVFNEELSIEKFLQSLLSQSKKPEEIIIVDAGSSDKTFFKIKNYGSNLIQSNSKFKIIIKPGNRSVGRNGAIKNATGDVIACSDAGCVLDKDWIKNIVEPFNDSKIDVVAGYYKPITESVFEKCLSIYTCVIEDRVDKENFLPSSRSIAFKKETWKKVRGYPEELDTCEDLVFAKKLKKAGFKFKFAEKAIVLWPQRKNILEAAKQFFNYAKGDGTALYLRAQTPFLFGRYFLLIILAYLLGKINIYPFFILFSIFLLYCFWSIKKNYRYINDFQALYFLPLLQITSDTMVMSGMLSGIIIKIFRLFHFANKGPSE